MEQEIVLLKAEIYDVTKQLRLAMTLLTQINSIVGGDSTEADLLNKISELVKKPA